MQEIPTVKYAEFLGRMFGLAESRHLLSPKQFDAAYAEIRAEYERQALAQEEFVRTPITLHPDTP